MSRSRHILPLSLALTDVSRPDAGEHPNLMQGRQQLVLGQVVVLQVAVHRQYMSDGGGTIIGGRISHHFHSPTPLPAPGSGRVCET